MGRIGVKLVLFLSIICSITGKNNLTKKRVCVIGAGPSGLFSVKQLADYLDMVEPIVFEKSSDIGGQWIYSDNGEVDEHGLPVQSGVFKSLRTTGPKETMVCPEFDFKGERRSCVRHETVLEYLRNYTDYFNLRPFIEINTLVEKVTPLPDDKDWRKTKWLVSTRNLNTNVSNEINCDFVMVCNGHTYKPSIPDIPGIETFPGRVLHSHSYRIPEEFLNQTVVLLGAATSGQELAFEISNYAETIYLSHRNKKIVTDWPKNVIQVAGVIAAEGCKLILQDNSTIKADSFIFCTGYKNDFSFLEASSGIEVGEKVLQPLYKQVINIEHPTMCFIGFPANVTYFCPKLQSQAKYCVALINGKVELPDRDEMMKDAELIFSEYPKLNRTDWEWAYLTNLTRAADSEPLDNFYLRGSELWDNHHDHNLRHYKEYDLRKFDNGSIAIVKSADE